MASGPRFLDILAVLSGYRVDYIVVGGVAAVLAGAPISTFDVDVVFERSEENLARLRAALEDLQAIYRDLAGRRIEPDLGKLKTLRQHLLFTRLGDLDVLTTVGADLGYEALVRRSRVVELGVLRVRVLDLEAVIETKEHANRPKDRATLPELRATLESRRGLS